MLSFFLLFIFIKKNSPGTEDISAENVKINPSLIQPSKEIKSIGNFDVMINLHSEVQTQIVISTVAQEEK